MLRLSGLSDEAISRLTSEAAITATLSVTAPQIGNRRRDHGFARASGVEQSAPLVKLARLSPLWVEIAVPASNIRAIRPGAKVDIDGYATPGQVVLVSETTDRRDPNRIWCAQRCRIQRRTAPRADRRGADRLSFVR